MARDKNEQPDKLDAGERLDRELSSSLSFLWGAVRPGSTSGVYAVYIRAKVGGTWTAVCKRATSDDATAYVAFGSGRTVGSALHSLSVSMSQGKWKRDMPWTGGR